MGNIAKTMTSNGKQFAVAIKWLFVFHRFDPFVLLYDKSLNNWSLGEQLFPSNLNVSLNFVSGNKIHCSPWDKSLSVNYKYQTACLKVLTLRAAFVIVNFF